MVHEVDERFCVDEVSILRKASVRKGEHWGNEKPYVGKNDTIWRVDIERLGFGVVEASSGWVAHWRNVQKWVSPDINSIIP